MLEDKHLLVEIEYPQKNFKITIENVSMELMGKLNIEKNIQTLFEVEYYLYRKYDEIEILENKFTIIRATKNSIGLLNNN